MPKKKPQTFRDLASAYLSILTLEGIVFQVNAIASEMSIRTTIDGMILMKKKFGDPPKISLETAEVYYELNDGFYKFIVTYRYPDLEDVKKILSIQ